MSAHIKDDGRSFSFLCHSFCIAQGQESVSGTGDSDERKFEKEKSCHFLVTHYHSGPNYAFLLCPPFLLLHLDSCLFWLFKKLPGVNESRREGCELIFVDPLLCGRLWKHDEFRKGYLTRRRTVACRW